MFLWWQNLLLIHLVDISFDEGDGVSQFSMPFFLKKKLKDVNV